MTTDLTLRVLTVNTHKGFTFFNRRFMLGELRDAVRGVGADLVFLQEVQGSYSGPPRRFANALDASHCEFLADEIWHEFAYGRNAVHARGDHGNALLSKYPILSWQNHDVSVEGEEQRGLLHCRIDIAGAPQPLHAICVHLGLKERDREQQLARLCATVAESVPPAAPLLVAGDFNDWRERAHRVLQQHAGLTEVHVAARGRAARSFPAHLPWLRLDRIYARNMHAHRTLALPRLPWSRLSDHAPLAAEVVL